MSVSTEEESPCVGFGDDERAVGSLGSPALVAEAALVEMDAEVMANRRGRRSCAYLILRHTGSPILAILVGAPDGRWSNELRSKKRPCAAVASALDTALQGSLDRIALDEGRRAVGIAVLEDWRCVTDQPSHHQASLLVRAASAFSPKRNVMRFLEHPVLAAALLDTRDGEAQNVADQLGSGHRLPQHSGRDILALLLQLKRRVRITLGHAASGAS